MNYDLRMGGQHATSLHPRPSSTEPGTNPRRDRPRSVVEAALDHTSSKMASTSSIRSPFRAPPLVDGGEEKIMG